MHRRSKSVASSPGTRGLVAVATLILFLGGCDDPTDVGLGLVDEDARDPVLETIDASEFALTDSTDVTGGVTVNGALRTLAGLVNDPLAGVVEATGHFDLSVVRDGGADFRNGSLESVELVLSFDYAYGDTTSTLEFELNGIAAAWSAEGRRSANAPTVDEAITTFSFDASSDEVRIALPSDWVEQHAIEIQTTSFESLFHGFQVRPISGNAVVGISSINSEMIAATTGNDTTRYAITRRHSTVSRSGGQIPSGTLLLQDGAHSIASLRFPIGDDEPGAAAIHRFLISLTRSSEVPPAPTHFVRPAVTQIGLRAVAVDQSTVLSIQTIDVAPDSEQLLFDSSVIVSVVQRALAQNSNLDRFEIFLPTVQSGVGFLLINDLAAGAGVPKAVVTLTDLD